MDGSGDRATESKNTEFRETRWSLIQRAADVRSPQSREALGELCKLYWYPLYAFVRRRGLDAPTTADLVQGFFAELIDGGLLESADREKGRFRSYLLGALKHFISNERDRAHAKKRGGGLVPVSLGDAEACYEREPSHELTPEALYDRRWALTLLDRVLDKLRQEHVAAGKERQFEQLKNLIAGPLPDQSYAQIAARLAMSEGAVKVAVHRLRERYRALLTAQIRETVATEADVEDEIRHLYVAIAGRS